MRLLTKLEHEVKQFYQWELRGRGWSIWPWPIEIEPPFRTFRLSAPREKDIAPGFEVDIEEAYARAAMTLGLYWGKPRGPIYPDFEVEPKPNVIGELAFDHYYLTLPREVEFSKVVNEQFLLTLNVCSSPVTFEIAGRGGRVGLGVVTRKTDTDIVLKQLRGHFPGISIEEAAGGEGDGDDEFPDSISACAVDFGLGSEFLLPIRTFRNLDADPLVGIVSSLAELAEYEGAILQIQFQRTKHPWAENVRQALATTGGARAIANDAAKADFAKQKLARPIFAAAIRLATFAPERDRARRLLDEVSSTLQQFDLAGSNKLVALEGADYQRTGEGDDEWDIFSSLGFRVTRRSGMLLNVDELCGLVHLPTLAVRAPGLRESEDESTFHTKAVPRVATGNEIILGDNEHDGETTEVSLSATQRLKHTHLIGASGTGKSTLLLNLILQDITQGNGAAVIDPHGDLIEQLLGLVPKDRVEDVILFDPADIDFPIAFNILSAHSEMEKELLASDLVAAFQRLSTSWGDQMHQVLAYAILAFLESSAGGSLLELRRFLIEKDFRGKFLDTVEDDQVRYYWRKEYPLLKSGSIGPIITRLETFIRPKVIRNLIGQQKNAIDFAKVMNEGKILLVKLAQGMIGEENSALLGSLFITKILQTTIARQRIPESERKDFFLYVDEFHHFVTKSLLSLLEGARKYHVGLVLAHQELRQLWKEDASAASAVLTNPCSRICFRVGEQDADKLADGFSFFEAEDLLNLGVGDAICRVERADYDFNLRTHELPKVGTKDAQQSRERIRDASRRAFGTSRNEVEASLRQRLAESEVEEAAPSPSKVARRRADLPELISAPEEVEASPLSVPPAKPKPPPVNVQSPEHTTSAFPKTPKPPATREVAELGRGGPEHRALQKTLQAYGHKRGYLSKIEYKLQDGKQVDVDFRKEGEDPIACEISQTTSAEHEFTNIEKCLKAGYKSILFVSQRHKLRVIVERLAKERLSPTKLGRVRFLEPKEVSRFLDERRAERVSAENVSRGFKVTINHSATSAGDAEARLRAVYGSLLKPRKPS